MPCDNDCHCFYMYLFYSRHTLIIWPTRTSRGLGYICLENELGIQQRRHRITFVTSEKCEREISSVREKKMARYKSKEGAIQPPRRLVTKGFPRAVGFLPDKSLCVKQGDRLVFIVLPGEGADSGVKGAIKVEWVRKGDLLEQMKRAWIKHAIGLNRMK